MVYDNMEMDFPAIFDRHQASLMRRMIRGHIDRQKHYLLYQTLERWADRWDDLISDMYSFEEEGVSWEFSETGRIGTPVTDHIAEFVAKLGAIESDKIVEEMSKVWAGDQSKEPKIPKKKPKT